MKVGLIANEMKLPNLSILNIIHKHLNQTTETKKLQTTLTLAKASKNI